MISNSLDVDFIHGDVHGRSCKNKWCMIYMEESITNITTKVNIYQQHIMLDLPYSDAYVNPKIQEHTEWKSFRHPLLK